MTKSHIRLIGVGVLLMVSCRGPQGPAGTGGDTLTDPSVQPAVVFTYPSHNSTGPFPRLYSPGYWTAPHFIVRFNKYMHTASVQGKVRVEGFERPVRVLLLPTFIIRWSEFQGGNDLYYDDLFLFAIYDSVSYFTPSYRIGQNYTVRIDSGIGDINGNRLALPFSFSTKPEPYFRISRVIPESGSVVQTSSQISTYFNGSLDTTIVAAVSLSPTVSGRWVLAADVESTRITFNYNSGVSLQNGTMYSINVSTAARDRYGNQLSQPFVSTFSTEPFRISETYPRDGATSVELQPTIQVYTTAILDTATIRPSFSLTPSVQGTFTLFSGRTYFLFTPSASLTPQRQYTANVSTGLKSKDGQNLPSPYTFSFTTGN